MLLGGIFERLKLFPIRLSLIHGLVALTSAFDIATTSPFFISEFAPSLPPLLLSLPRAYRAHPRLHLPFRLLFVLLMVSADPSAPSLCMSLSTPILQNIYSPRSPFTTSLTCVLVLSDLLIENFLPRQSQEQITALDSFLQHPPCCRVIRTRSSAAPLSLPLRLGSSFPFWLFSA